MLTTSIYIATEAGKKRNKKKKKPISTPSTSEHMQSTLSTPSSVAEQRNDIMDESAVGTAVGGSVGGVVEEIPFEDPG